jgi:hypothetical protein
LHGKSFINFIGPTFSIHVSKIPLLKELYCRLPVGEYARESFYIYFPPKKVIFSPDLYFLSGSLYEILQQNLKQFLGMYIWDQEKMLDERTLSKIS